MLARVRRIEETRKPALSFFERDYGSLDAFSNHVRSMVDEGLLDRRDMLGANGDGGVLGALVGWGAYER